MITESIAERAEGLRLLANVERSFSAPKCRTERACHLTFRTRPEWMQRFHIRRPWDACTGPSAIGWCST
jgi:hypothetical protein